MSWKRCPAHLGAATQNPEILVSCAALEFCSGGGGKGEDREDPSPSVATVSWYLLFGCAETK